MPIQLINLGSAPNDGTGDSLRDMGEKVNVSLQSLQDQITALIGGGGGTVSSVNGQTGSVVLAAADVGALPDSYVPAWADVTGKPTTLGGYGIADAQPLDGDLTALAALSGTNIIPARTAANTWAALAFGAGLALTAGTLAPANDLAALEALSSTGFAVRTGSEAWAQRSIAVSGAGLSVANGSGAGGDPTLSLADDLAALEALSGTGYAKRTGTNTWSVSGAIPYSDLSGAPSLATVATTGAYADLSGNPTLALANDLAALEGLGSTGLAVRSAADTWLQRSIAAGTGLSVSNGDGVSGNPTLSLSHLGLQSLTDPNADRFAFWDDSAGAFAWLAPDGTLTISGTTLSATAATTTQAGVSELATAAEYIAATAGALALTPAQVWAAAARVTLTDAATITANFATFLNSQCALAGNRTLGAPSGTLDGQCGVMWFTATTSTRTLTLNAAYALATGVEAGPYSITTTEDFGLAYHVHNSEVVITGVLRA